MLVLHIPALIDYNDTVSDNFSTISGATPTYINEASSPLSRYMSISSTTTSQLVYTPNMHRTTKASVAFWYRCDGVNNASATFRIVMSLVTQGVTTSQNFRLERTNLATNSYKMFNNGVFSNLGGWMPLTVEDNKWYHIAFNADLETGEWECWFTPLDTLVTSKTSGKLTIIEQSYFTDKFFINKAAEISGASYADIRVYDYLISDYEVHEILKRKVLHYTFDSTLQQITAEDFSGMGNDAEVVKDVDYSELNKIGNNCAQFNGTSSYIQVPRTAMISGSFTISFWAYMSDWTSVMGAGAKALVSCAETGGWVFDLYDGTLGGKHCTMVWELYSGGAYSDLAVDFDLSLLNSASESGSGCNWHHFALLFDSGRLLLYIDGVQVGDSLTTKSTEVTYNANNKIIIGAEATGTGANGDWFGGKIDDFKIYASALSPEDIEKEAHRRLILDDKFGLHCKWISELPSNAVNLITDSGFEYNDIVTKSHARMTFGRTTEESYEGSYSLKITSGILTPTRSLTGMTGVTITYDATRDVYTFNGTSGAGTGLASFIWVPIPDSKAAVGKNVIATAEYVSGTITLTNETSGACYACPVVDIGTAINTNVPTRHHSDFNKYPDATTKTVSRTIALTQADVDAIKGIRIWLHTRGASEGNYGKTIVMFTNYTVKFRLDIDVATEDNYLTIQNTPFIDETHKYYVSVRAKSNAAFSSQVYLGAWEFSPIATTLSSDNKWHLYSGITNDTWKTNAAGKADSSKYLRIDFDTTKYSTTPPTSYWDDVKVIDLTTTYGCGLDLVTESPAGNILTGFKFQVYNTDDSYKQLYTYADTAQKTYTLYFMKSENTAVMRFGFNGNKNDCCQGIDVSKWPNGNYELKLIIVSRVEGTGATDSVASGHCKLYVTNYPIDLSSCLTSSRTGNVTVTPITADILPTKAECDALFNGESSTPKITLCDDKGVLSASQVSEFGRPMRYIKLTVAGESANAATVDHLLRVDVNTLSNGKINLLDAFKADYSKLISGFTSYTASSTRPYVSANRGVLDIGSVEFVSSIHVQRYYFDNRYYYGVKVEGSIDNKTYFTIWDSHNTGTYASDNKFNTYVETEEGTTFLVEPDKFYLSQSGILVANRVMED